MTILVFQLASERYAISVEDARQVLLAVRVTPLPDSPSVIEGVVDVQGALVPVYDMGRRFGLPEEDLSVEDHFILAAVGGREVLLHVSRVHGVEEVEVEERPAVGGVERIAGVARLEDGLVLIHDLRTFLTAAERDSLEGALSATGGPGGGGT